MQRIAFNNNLDAVVCGLFVLLVLAMCLHAIRIGVQTLHKPVPSTVEIPSLQGVD